MIQLNVDYETYLKLVNLKRLEKPIESINILFSPNISQKVLNNHKLSSDLDRISNDTQIPKRIIIGLLEQAGNINEKDNNIDDD